MQTVNTYFAHVPSAPCLEYSEACWAEISDDDYAHLTTPRNYPPPCEWCDERGIHHPCCDDPRQLWEATVSPTPTTELHEAIQHDLQQENSR